MDCTHQAPLSMGFPRQEDWNGLPFPSPEDLPNPGIKPASPVSPALAGRFFTGKPQGCPIIGNPKILSWCDSGDYAVNASSCIRLHTKRPNKLEHRCLEQRKVYCKVMKRDEPAHALRSLKLPKGFQQSIFKGQVGGGGSQDSDQCVHSSLIGWWWGNRVGSWGLTLSVFRLQEAWGYELIGIK